MIGGPGNDTYIVDNTGDLVTENDGEGMDAVQSSLTYTLAANVDNLTLTGAAAIDGIGNALDNVLTGNSAVNTLTGAPATTPSMVAPAQIRWSAERVTTSTSSTTQPTS